MLSKMKFFVQALKNTAIWVFISLSFQFVLGFSLALLLRKPFKGRGIYTALVFYPWAVSGFVIAFNGVGCFMVLQVL